MEEIYKEYRVKTQEELWEELGANWRNSGQLMWIDQMDGYFGEIILMKPYVGTRYNGEPYEGLWFEAIPMNLGSDGYKFRESWIEELVELEF